MYHLAALDPHYAVRKSVIATPTKPAPPVEGHVLLEWAHVREAVIANEKPQELPESARGDRGG